jgi:Uma2 family endonuclease
MGMAVTYYTADMVRALPDDGQRYEVVTPAPRLWHQEVVRRIGRLLEDYTERVGLGHVFHSPAALSWGDDTLVHRTCSSCR